MDRELTFHPQTEPTRDLIYSEYSSCDRSIHLLSGKSGVSVRARSRGVQGHGFGVPVLREPPSPGGFSRRSAVALRRVNQKQRCRRGSVEKRGDSRRPPKRGRRLHRDIARIGDPRALGWRTRHPRRFDFRKGGEAPFRSRKRRRRELFPTSLGAFLSVLKLESAAASGATSYWDVAMAKDRPSSTACPFPRGQGPPEGRTAERCVSRSFRRSSSTGF